MASKTEARRGRPPRISTEQIVDAALDLAVEELSIAAVARELGVAAPAIYRYFDSREALQAAVLARVLDGADFGRAAGWREYLTSLAEQVEGVLLTYPALIGVNAAPHWDVLGPLVAPLLNGALARLLPAGFSAAEGLALYNAVTALVHEAARVRVTFAGLVEEPSYEGIDAGPDTAAVLAVLRDGPRFGVASSDTLRWLLDGAEAAVRGRR